MWLGKGMKEKGMKEGYEREIGSHDQKFVGSLMRVRNSIEVFTL
jgi:hypothetical protein